MILSDFRANKNYYLKKDIGFHKNSGLELKLKQGSMLVFTGKLNEGFVYQFNLIGSFITIELSNTDVLKYVSDFVENVESNPGQSHAR